jgi:hypothetical protein
MLKWPISRQTFMTQQWNSLFCIFFPKPVIFNINEMPLTFKKKLFLFEIRCLKNKFNQFWSYGAIFSWNFSQIDQKLILGKFGEILAGFKFFPVSRRTFWVQSCGKLRELSVIKYVFFLFKKIKIKLVNVLYHNKEKIDTCPFYFKLGSCWVKATAI